MSNPTVSPETGEHLIAMANDIGNYFRSQPRAEAVAGIANHLKKFWAPRMLQKLNVYLAQGNEGLDELPRAAVDSLNKGAGAAPAITDTPTANR